MRETDETRGWVLWSSGLLLTLILHLLWQAVDARPPLWDMAYHQLQGWRYLEAWQNGELPGRLAQLSPYYPPLYYLQEAALLRFFPTVKWLALPVNSLGLAILSASSYRIASRVMAPQAAALAGLLPLWFPLVAWLTRTSMLDLSLAGWVTLAAYLLLKSEYLVRPGWSALFGLACAAGFLTKWTFLIFVLPMVIYLLLFSADRARSLANVGLASMLAVPLTIWWLMPNLDFLLNRFEVTSEAAVWEGDPGWNHPLGWIYYPRVLASYYLFLPLTLLFSFGVFRRWREGAGLPSHPERFLWWWLLGGMALLSLMGAKDPRYVMPLSAPISILMVSAWRTRRKGLPGIALVAFLQFLTVSFATPVHPVKLALFEVKGDEAFRSARQEWVLYSSHYFGLMGPPEGQAWPFPEIFEGLRDGDSVGMIADTPYFNPLTLELEATRHGRALSLIPISRAEPAGEIAPSLDWILAMSGSQGFSYEKVRDPENYRYLRDAGWSLVRSWPLPDGSRAELWKNPGR